MEYFDNLKEIKEQLFDAPIEVKKAFNQVVEYFAMPKGFMDWANKQPEYIAFQEKKDEEIKKLNPNDKDYSTKCHNIRTDGYDELIGKLKNKYFKQM